MANPPNRRPTLKELATAPGKRGKRTTRGKEMGDIMGWGSGNTNSEAKMEADIPEAIARIYTLTRRYLENEGVTAEEAWDWTHAYDEVSRMNAANPSAGVRALLMQCAARLLENPDEDAAGPDCCQEELRLFGNMRHGQIHET